MPYPVQTKAKNNSIRINTLRNLNQHSSWFKQTDNLTNFKVTLHCWEDLTVMWRWDEQCEDEMSCTPLLKVFYSALELRGLVSNFHVEMSGWLLCEIALSSCAGHWDSFCVLQKKMETRHKHSDQAWLCSWCLWCHWESGQSVLEDCLIF